MLVDNDFTLLEIIETGVAPYSARGLTQTLEPIPQSSSMRRTARGKLRDLSNSRFRLFRTTINCSDMNTPAFSQVFPGAPVTIHCVAELGYRDESSGAAIRPAVPGSERIENGFRFYRPILLCLIEGFDWRKDEYGGRVGWTLTASEVGA